MWSQNCYGFISSQFQELQSGTVAVAVAIEEAGILCHWRKAWKAPTCHWRLLSKAWTKLKVAFSVFQFQEGLSGSVAQWQYKRQVFSATRVESLESPNMPLTAPSYLADFPAVIFHICNFDICHEIQQAVMIWPEFPVTLRHTLFAILGFWEFFVQ